jgi:protein phosphatase
MLVCPYCRLENLNAHKFCQRCGSSLTHKRCHECGESVAFDRPNCSHCGAFTGTVWQAIIAEADTQTGSIAEKTVPWQREYLDPGKRYRLNPSEQSPQGTIWQERVLDCHPLEKSVLAVFLEQEEALEDPTTKTAFWQQIGIPDLALPYITLKDYSPMVPVLHDAWQEGNTQVILLPDRSEWFILAELLATEDLPSLQIVTWLSDLVSLWQVLGEAKCSESLRVETNIRVDSQNNLALQQLYADTPKTQLTLQHLLQMWKHWLAKSSSPLSEPVLALLDRGAKGEIATAEALQVELQHFLHGGAESLDTDNLDTDSLPFEVEWETLEEPEDKLENLGGSQDLSVIGELQQRLQESGDDQDLSTATLPKPLLSLEDAGCTDRGRQRHHNEDSLSITTQFKKQQNNRDCRVEARGLYIVCDGMGGHAAGEVASAMAVETLQQYFTQHWQDTLPDRDTIKQGIFLANEEIYKVNQTNAKSGNGRMGTTLVMAFVQDTSAAIAHVGDSRIYRIDRQDGLTPLTVDHEVGQQAIQRGVDPKTAYSRREAYQLTQAIGPYDSQFIEPAIEFLELQEDTLLLLCSDGLSDNHLIEKHWRTYLLPLIDPSHPLEAGLRQLIQFANQENGHDNITAILVRTLVRSY